MANAKQRAKARKKAEQEKQKTTKENRMKVGGGNSKYGKKQGGRPKTDGPELAAEGGIRPDADVKADWQIARDEEGTGFRAPRVGLREKGYDFRSACVMKTDAFFIRENAETKLRFMENDVDIPKLGEGSDIKAITIVAVQTGIHDDMDHMDRPRETPIWNVGFIRGYSATDPKGRSAFQLVQQVIRHSKRLRGL